MKWKDDFFLLLTKGFTHFTFEGDLITMKKPFIENVFEGHHSLFAERDPIRDLKT